MFKIIEISGGIQTDKNDRQKQTTLTLAGRLVF